MRSSTSYCVASDPRVHLGLGEADAVDSVEVRWVDGTTETFGPLDAGSTHILARGSGHE